MSSIEQFTEGRLIAITPEDIVRYFNHRSYGTETPSPEDHPTHGRVHSLYAWKKALSYFMPNKNMEWNEIYRAGNPTKSVQVNEMIKIVKRFEVRK